jgi:hypothetical protein
MPAAKRKPRQEPPEAPPVPDSRLGLHEAIERHKQAEHLVAEQREAVARSQALLSEAEDQVEKLRRKIEAADASDVSRAASLIKVERPVVSPWSGENARSAVKRAEEHVALTERAKAKLRSELAELELAAKVALNDVLVERIKLIAPIAGAKLERLKVLRTETSECVATLDALVVDNAPAFTPGELIQSKNCEDARLEAFNGVRAEAAQYVVSGETFEEFDLKKAITAEWTRKLAVLLVDPTGEI